MCWMAMKEKDFCFHASRIRPLLCSVRRNRHFATSIRRRGPWLILIFKVKFEIWIFDASEIFFRGDSRESLKFRVFFGNLKKFCFTIAEYSHLPKLDFIVWVSLEKIELKKLFHSHDWFRFFLDVITLLFDRLPSRGRGRLRVFLLEHSKSESNPLFRFVVLSTRCSVMTMVPKSLNRSMSAPDWPFPAKAFPTRSCDLVSDNAWPRKIQV